MVRIICIGNRLFAPDAAGCLVHDFLQKNDLAGRAELIEGGLTGLDLLPFFENCQRVVLVDRVDGFGSRDGIVHLQPADLAGMETRYDHSGGLGYLLASLPALGLNPEIHIIGIQGDAHGPVIKQAARLAHKLAHAL